LLGEVDHRGALFGLFPVGETVRGNLYYTRRSLCGNQTAGTPASIQKQEFFLLVDRGGCSFVEKVRNAQKENVTALLVADNKCLCSFAADVCQADEQCVDAEPIMDDDGTGSDIRIPSMLLLKPDADRLKNELLAGTPVQLQLSWPVPQAVNGVAEYTVWMTPDDILSHQFLSSFWEAAAELGDRAVFRPRMFIHDGTQKGCRRYGNGEDPCNGSCTNFGRYCAPRSVYDFNTYENKGTLILVESLRRACIWDVYGEADGIGYEWWNYVQSWISRCGNSRYSASCAESIYATSGIERQLVETCMMESGNFRNNTSNTLLDQYLTEADDYDVTFAPTLFVNDAVVRGALTFGNVLEAICMTYAENDIPEICFNWESCSEMCGDQQVCVLRNGDCVLYEVPPYDEFETAWDDDYLTSPWILDEATPESPAPTTALITPSPTRAPVQVVTKAPTVAPVVPPFAAPVPVQVAPPAEGFNPGTTPTNSGLSETIQIFEGGSGTHATVRGDRDAGFAVGLAAGLLAAICLVMSSFIVIRKRRRNARALAPHGGLQIRSSYFDDGSLEEDVDYIDEYEEDVYNPRSSRSRIVQPQRIRLPRLPRRFIRRSRTKSSASFHRKRTLHVAESDDEAELAVQPRLSFGAQHSRKFQHEFMDADVGSSGDEEY